jgi:hypothetical protein
LANLRLQHDNLQSTLRATNDKLKAGEKENRGLQYGAMRDHPPALNADI